MIDNGETCRPPTVLFLCTANSARSQMAEGLLRYIGGGRFEVMRHRVIDISAQRPKPLSGFEGRRFDLLITACDDANQSCPVPPAPENACTGPSPIPPRPLTPKERMT